MGRFDCKVTLLYKYARHHSEITFRHKTITGSQQGICSTN